MYVYVVEVIVVFALEEELPKGSEVEIGVGEKEEGDFRFGVGGSEAGDGGESGATEEGEVVELVRERDLEVFGREDSGGE